MNYYTTELTLAFIDLSGKLLAFHLQKRQTRPESLHHLLRRPTVSQTRSETPPQQRNINKLTYFSTPSTTSPVQPVEDDEAKNQPRMNRIINDCRI